MSKKRKTFENENKCIWDILYTTDNRKRIKNNQSKHDWISASKTKNYILNDTCIDWLESYYHRKGIGGDELLPQDNRLVISRKSNNLELLFDGGHISENKLYDELKEVYRDDFVIVFEESDYLKFCAEATMNGWIREKYNQTIQLMESGTPLIGQAVMINDRNATYGVADILIRSDYLENLFDNFEPDPYINHQAPKLKKVRGYKNKGTRYHYRVVDYKWSMMMLCVDGKTVRNTGRFPAYKGQLAIYTACLEQMQGYAPTVAYLMCKGWKIDRAITKPEECGYSCFDRPGVIDYMGKDKHFIQLTKEAVDWISRVQKDGMTWEYGKDRPTVVEMYPNMNKQTDPKFNKVKQELAERYNDLTQIWYVDHRHREIARNHGIDSCKDARLNARLLGIDGKRGPIIDQIIQINRSTTEELINPPIIMNNMKDWQKESDMDYYIDMETINMNLFMDPKKMDIDHNYTGSDVTFMIGIGFKNNQTIDSRKILNSLDMNICRIGHHINHTDDGWEFICLYLQEFNQTDEAELYQTLYQFISERKKILKSKKKIRFFHWTSAELRFMDRAHSRIKALNWNKSNNLSNKLLRFVANELIWVDMCDVFQSEPIVVKGAYRFKLKAVARAMYDNQMISTLWKNDTMSDGFSAMISAIELYRDSIHLNKKKRGINKELCKEYMEIVLYNEIDCKVMWEIVNYLRTNHCKPQIKPKSRRKK